MAEFYSSFAMAGAAVSFGELWHWSVLLAVPLIAFLSAGIGSFTGLGGGMITRPLMNVYMTIPGTTGLAAGYSLTSVIGTAAGDAVSIISNAGVMANSSVAVPKYMKSGVKVNWKIVTWLAVGLLIGQLFIGNQIYYMMVNGKLFGTIAVGEGMGASGANYIDLAYSIFLFFVFFVVFFQHKLPKVKSPSNNIGAMVGIGLFIGLIAGLFGVSGGAIKMPFLILFLGLSIREAAVYSLTLALVSSPIKMLTSYLHMAAIEVDPTVVQATAEASMAWASTAMAISIPFAIAGSFTGVRVQRKSSDKVVKIVLAATLLFFGLLGIFNAVWYMVDGMKPIEAIFAQQTTTSMSQLAETLTQVNVVNF